jgi:hypothetical protein
MFGERGTPTSITEIFPELPGGTLYQSVNSCQTAPTNQPERTDEEQEATLFLQEGANIPYSVACC